MPKVVPGKALNAVFHRRHGLHRMERARYGAFGDGFVEHVQGRNPGAVDYALAWIPPDV